ncbi:MAG: hypothetical protein MJY68_00355 [Bacteroidaceae bacterium]|nr:hypothetical protein [Bacteroidaceae bacterium]
MYHATNVRHAHTHRKDNTRSAPHRLTALAQGRGIGRAMGQEQRDRLRV